MKAPIQRNLNTIITNVFSLKAYLEDFCKFCKELGGATADVMCEILAVSI